MQIQLYFENPLMVSANVIPDKVRLTFNDPTLFMGMNGLIMKRDSEIIEKYLIQQIRL